MRIPSLALSLLVIIALAGCAASAPAPSASSTWGTKVSSALWPHLDYPASKPEPKLPTEFIVWLAPHGVITDKVMFNSSGVPEWDMVASLALRNAYRLPPDSTGKVPYQAVITIAPARISAAAVNVPRPGIGRDDRPTYAEKIAEVIRRHVVFADAEQLSGNPAVDLDVRLGLDGSIKSVYVAKPSGYPDWDVAARRAVLKADILPLDTNGTVPPRMLISMHPKR